MRVQLIYLDKYDWLIKIFYAVDNYYADTILEELDSLDCEPDTLYRVVEMMDNFELNMGFTYTDPAKHITFVILGLAESADEFMNTYIHEVGHAAMHITEYYKINPFSEEFQYLLGSICQEMFSVAKDFLCDHCRNKVINLYNYGKMKIKVKKGS